MVGIGILEVLDDIPPSSIGSRGRVTTSEVIRKEMG